MDKETLTNLIKNHRPLTLRYYDQKSYRIGLNAGIFQERDKPAPDNRIPVPFIRRANKLLKGYFAKPGNITYQDDNEWFENNLKDIYDKNNEALETASMFEDSISYGSAFELHWFNADTGFHFAVLPVDQCIPIYSDDLVPELTGFVWYRRVANGDEIATYYGQKEYQDWTRANGATEWTPGEVNLHLYGKVPVLEANTDRDKRNAFDHCLPLIDIYDKLTSEVGNEHQKFAESILLLRNKIDDVTKDENGLTDVDKINELRILDKLGDNVSSAAAYLQRNVNDGFINNTLDRWERLIYEMLCIFNPSDTAFGTASGIAQAYKLLGFEYLVSDMESYFSLFLYNRIKMISGHKSGRVKDIESQDFVTVKFIRNLPFDIEKLITMASVASGGKQTLPMENIINLFPDSIIPDKKKALELLQDESSQESLPSPDDAIV